MRFVRWIILTIIAVVMAIALLPISKPEFFDVFGVLTFIYLFSIGIWMLHSKKKLPNWVAFTLISIGFLGLIVDGFIVIKNYLF